MGVIVFKSVLLNFCRNIIYESTIFIGHDMNDRSIFIKRTQMLRHFLNGNMNFKRFLMGNLKTTKFCNTF